MSRLKDKQCSILKKKCLIEGCCHYDANLDACAWNLLPYNLYKVAIAIERSMPVSPAPQPTFPGYSGRR